MPTFLFVKKAYVEMECTLTMEIYIVKYKPSGFVSSIVWGIYRYPS